MEQRVTRLETDMVHMTRSIDELSKQVSDLTHALERYRGAWGMLLMIGTAISGAVAIWFKVRSN